MTLALLGALLAAAVVDLTVGAAHLSLSDILPMLWPGSAPCNELYQVVFWSIRLPMTLTALVVGASPALAGLLMQTVLANPRQPVYAGDLGRGGIWRGAVDHHRIQPGGALALGTPLLASLMALLACVPIYLLGQRRGMTPQILVLSGIVVLFFFQSLQSLLLFLASPEAMQQIVFWLFGSLLKANMHGVAITGGVLFCALVVSLRLARA